MEAASLLNALLLNHANSKMLQNVKTINVSHAVQILTAVNFLTLLIVITECVLNAKAIPQTAFHLQNRSALKMNVLNPAQAL